MINKNKRIAIIGAGPTGLFLAALLSKLNYQIDIFDKSPILNSQGCGIMLLPNGLRAVKRGNSKIYELLEKKGVILDCFDIIDTVTQNKTVVPLTEYPQKYGFPTIYIHRSLINEILLQFIHTKSLHSNCLLLNLQLLNNQIIANFDNGQVWEGDLIIGADGIFSKVRESICEKVSPQYLGAISWRGVVENNGYCPEKHFVLFKRFEGVYANISDLGDNFVHWGVFLDTPELPAISEKHCNLIEEILTKDLAKKLVPDLRSAIRATPIHKIVKRPIFDIDPLSEIVGNKIALIGDAAHPMSPTRGQGLNTGLEDAFVLAKLLEVYCDNFQTALEEYEKERLPRVIHIQKTSRERSLFNRQNLPKNNRKSSINSNLDLLTYSFSM